MLITVAICTRNRATSLVETLRSLASCKSPGVSPWEVLVIDNGSSDNTSDVVRSFGSEIPIRCIYEPKAGLSNARNRAVGEARGQYIVWTDDDVLVDENWLLAYARAFATYPDAGVFGGKALPLHENPPPWWLKRTHDDFGAAYAHRDFGDLEIDLTPDRLPFGLNFAVRTQEQRRELYDPELGVAPGRRRGGEETRVLESLLRSGARGRWIPDAIVLHRITPDRQTVAFLAKYYQAQGETDAILTEREGRTATMLLFAPRWIWRKFILGMARYALCHALFGSRWWALSLKEYQSARGALMYFLRSRGTADRPT